MPITGFLPQDSTGDKFVGPILDDGVLGRAFRGSNATAEALDLNVVLFDTAATALLTAANPGYVRLAAGASSIGTVRIDQTSPYNQVQLLAGAAIVGLVGIDTAANTVKLDGTTNTVKIDATTNTVKINQTSPNNQVQLIAGAAVVGRVGIDQTTDGTTNKVSAGQNGTWTVALASGTNVGRTRGTKTGTQVTVGTTAVLVVAAAAGRISALIANAGAQVLYLGPTAGVTTANGLPLGVGSTLSDDDTTDAWYAIAASAGGDARVVTVA